MIILYGSNGSPFVSRVRMLAYVKEIPIELRPAALGTPEYQRMNPLNKMPVLEHDGFFVPESAVICEYLEEAFPSPSVLGTDIRERARVRLVARTVDLYLSGVFELLRAAADPSFKVDVTAKRAELNRGLDALETFLADEGDFALGDKLSLADCALVPWLFYGNMLTASGDDSLTRRPKIARYAAKIGEFDLAKRIWGDMDEAFRAFMTRWKAEQAASKAG
ncbi:MAG: glutathione S-transferase family protein [Polyangiaceae bacterium]|nr:glutathione S-transferase family protein [Polyangiaceae bacterium]NUQ76209.1 glutathione S-transferase family protein [Polyangiaceae bacterium]